MRARAPRSRCGRVKKGGGHDGAAPIAQKTLWARPAGLGRTGARMNGSRLDGKPCRRAAPRIPPLSLHAISGKAGNDGHEQRYRAIA